ncbi:uncharacterized protein J8A68_004890 [[Candida] subhashii]|uniref:Uncharacterized protein n=1 Tax=[Candida] subhashii TaxID=561895 RepID=A0A8J5UK32_9ASCO|nr:uncharacterized protein J8A68_004890 [[Candida] subhashii]KAG7661621.1 hypothetical protein J8A68_004890 [[Candida] subhashii]
MAVHLSSEDTVLTERLVSLLDTEAITGLQAYVTDEDDEEEEEHDEDEDCSDVESEDENYPSTFNSESQLNPQEDRDIMSNSIQSFHEYELNQSESLTFLYNLLYDNASQLSKSDILVILNALKVREDSLPFSIDTLEYNDVQGVRWPRELRRKFYNDRLRVGKDNYFHNIPDSREKALKSVDVLGYQIKTDFFKFHKFFSKLKLHITHLQLRNLVCCGPNIGNGIFYPSSYYHDSHLRTVNVLDDADEEYHAFFKINRLMNDKTGCEKSDSMKLDCLIDSRTLIKNSNSRISTLACSNNYLASGTFEGGYILSDISDPDNVKTLGEYHLTNNIDGITNQIIVNEKDNELIISSNDKSLRLIDLNTHKTTSLNTLPFPLNYTAINPHNSNEIFVTGDCINSFILDKRIKFDDSGNKVQFECHDDFGFGCDWSPRDENILLTGNQDSCVKLWDRRNPKKALYAWSGTLGFSDSAYGGPVRNCKFSYHGNYIAWAESLDHVGIIQMDDLFNTRDDGILSRVQSIDFIGKCAGLNFAPIEQGYGEQLIIGVIDCPLGGILSYKLPSSHKSLDFDFYF